MDILCPALAALPPSRECRPVSLCLSVPLALSFARLVTMMVVINNAPSALVRRRNHVGNLVDSASSHTLVSKIKPCMSKYKRLIL